MQPSRLTSITALALLLLTMLPWPAGAQTSVTEEWGADMFLVNSLQANNQHLDVNSENGKIIVANLQENGATDTCRIAISSNGGVSWVPSKQVSGMNNAKCMVAWLDADSFIVTNGFNIQRSDDLGIMLSALTNINTPGSSETIRDLYVVDSDSWRVLVDAGSDTYAARTDNAGSTWAYSSVMTNLDASEFSLDRDPSGTWYFRGTVSGESRVYYSLDDTATFAIYSPALSSSFNYGSGGLWDDAFGLYIVPTRFNTANSLVTNDIGFASTNGGAWAYGGEYIASGGITTGDTGQFLAFEGAPGQVGLVLSITGGTPTPQTIIGLRSSSWAWRIVEDLDTLASDSWSVDIDDETMVLGIVEPAGAVAASRAQVLVGEVFGPVAAGYVPIFCSANGNPDFGYEYVEDVSLEEDDSGSLSSTDQIERPAYVFQGYSGSGDDGEGGDFAYLAKSWDPGVKTASNYFTIEAQRDEESSIFRSNFVTLSTTPTSVTKGNGLDTQAFSAHIEAQFTEVDNDWNVRIYHVNTANGVSERTQLGASFVGDAPNTPTHYNFTVDLVNLRAVVRHFVNSVETDMLNVSIPSYWGTAYLYAHWYVGYGTTVGVLGGTPYAYTNLDSGMGDVTSTCIYTADTEAGVTPNGDPGRVAPPPSVLGNQSAHTPQTEVVDPEPDGDGLFGSLDETLFMGFLFVFGVVWMGVRQGAGAAAIGALFFVGIGMAYAIGWIPLWFILVMTIISLAAVWFLPKPNDGGLG